MGGHSRTEAPSGRVYGQGVRWGDAVRFKTLDAGWGLEPFSAGGAVWKSLRAKDGEFATVEDLLRSHSVDEILDIFDEHMHQIGTASRLIAHQTGAWHQTFHCWALHRTQAADYLLLQRRHESKDTHPDKLDVSCGGHLEAGETPSDGVRELNEELGIEVDFISLFPVGVHRHAADFGDVKDCEFCHVFVLVRTGETLSGYTPATGEVSGLYLIRVDEMEKLCLGEVEAAPIVGFEVDTVGRRLDRSIEIGRNDLVWHGASYFHMLFDRIRSLHL